MSYHKRAFPVGEEQLVSPAEHNLQADIVLASVENDPTLQRVQEEPVK